MSSWRRDGPLLRVPGPRLCGPTNWALQGNRYDPPPLPPLQHFGLLLACATGEIWGNQLDRGGGQRPVRQSVLRSFFHSHSTSTQDVRKPLRKVLLRVNFIQDHWLEACEREDARLFVWDTGRGMQLLRLKRHLRLTRCDCHKGGRRGRRHCQLLPLIPAMYHHQPAPASFQTILLHYGLTM